MSSAGGWVCPDCHSINVASSSRCYSCHRAVDPSSPAGAAWTPIPPIRQDGAESAPAYRPATTRARWARILVGIVATGHGVAAMSGLYELWLLDRIVAGTATDPEVEGYLQFADVLGLLVVLLTVVSGIAVLAWLSRTVEIVPALGGGTPRRSPREAIGWWFVPIANLFVPYVIVRDVHVRLQTPSRRGGDAFVLAWWLLFIVGDVVCRAAVVAVSGATTIDEIRGGGMILIFGNVATAVGGLLLVSIIGEIDARAVERATPRASGDPVDPMVVASPAPAAEWSGGART